MICQSALPWNKIPKFLSAVRANNKMSSKGLLVEREVAIGKRVGKQTYCIMLFVFLQRPK